MLLGGTLLLLRSDRASDLCYCCQDFSCDLVYNDADLGLFVYITLLDNGSGSVYLLHTL